MPCSYHSSVPPSPQFRQLKGYTIKQTTTTTTILRHRQRLSTALSIIHTYTCTACTSIYIYMYIYAICQNTAKTKTEKNSKKQKTNNGISESLFVSALFSKSLSLVLALVEFFIIPVLRWHHAKKPCFNTL